ESSSRMILHLRRSLKGCGVKEGFSLSTLEVHSIHYKSFLVDYPKALIRTLIKKGVITAAGLGTRLLSVTKAQPKEMLPVFAKCRDGSVCMKPIVQLVFEDLYNIGIRDFCFVVGRGQRTIREHFTPDFSYLSILDKRGKNGLAKELESFHEMVRRSN